MIAPFVHKGANGDADFLSDQLFERLGVHLQRDHFELLLSALHDVFAEDLRTQRLGPHFTCFAVSTGRLCVDVLTRPLSVSMAIYCSSGRASNSSMTPRAFSKKS